MYWLHEVLERTFTPERYAQRTAQKRERADHVYQEYFKHTLRADSAIRKSIKTSQLLADVLLENKER